MSTLETHYSARGIEQRILSALRDAGLDPEHPLTPGEIAALDHFHTGGLQSSRELIDVAEIRADDHVLDIGAGLAGCARLLAHEVGCRVSCVELSSDYCEGARLLNQLTGLEDTIQVHQGSALDLPFPDNSFDVVWMQNVGMNIAVKDTLYAEIARVLRPGGRFAFQEMAGGEVEACYYPLPWATDPADNCLVSGEEMCELLEKCGFTTGVFEDISGHDFNSNVANATPAAEGELGLAVYVDDLATKAGNARRSMQEGQVRLVRGVFRW